MPSITGRLEVNLTVRDPVRSAAWYEVLLGMETLYEFVSPNDGMYYISLVEPESELVLCLVGHATNPGEPFREVVTGLDHLEFMVQAGRSSTSGRTASTTSAFPTPGSRSRPTPAMRC